MINPRALVNAAFYGAVLQSAMVLTGHWFELIQSGFAAGGMGLSLVAGLIYGRTAGSGWFGSLIGGALAGGICAAVGLAISYSLGDIESYVLPFAVGSSTVAGAIGGLLGRTTAAKPAASA